jgi:glycosyltransferase involved in cell wall biosynthesis
MKIGYLHIGAPEHGIVRYGRYLAKEARTRPELSVIEAEVVLTGDQSVDRQNLQVAAKTLSQADIVHFQHNSSIWGNSWQQIHNLDTFFDLCSVPLVVTLHDIFYSPSSKVLAQRYFSSPGTARFFEFARALLRDQLSPKILALHKVVARSRVVLVCTQEEARRLNDRIATSKVQIIPHFVETRKIQFSREEARKSLDLEGFIVITILGFIYSGKGHQLLIQALCDLPETVKVVFAGGVSSGHEAYYQKLMTLAKAERVHDRIRVTGYLSELELERYLLATDLAVCPFRQTSASGSLSTWLSVACPILASSIPQVAEYNALAPGAIKNFEDYTPNGLKAAILEFLATGCKPEDHKIAALRHQLSIANIFAQHLHYYNRLLEFGYVA